MLTVFDKSGLVEFARGLLDLGWQLIASGGTARLLREHSLPVSEVSDYTASPEILGGRVKTLHPAIHGGLLARPTAQDAAELRSLGWEPIDLAAVNLYPFQETVARPDASLADAIENIDIGGVALIRAAAKNHARVTLVCDPADYPAVLAALRAGGTSPEMRRALAVKGFRLSAEYDRAIATYLAEVEKPGHAPDQPAAAKEILVLYPVQSLRYGENPHQSAALFSFEPGQGPLGGRVLQGKELSYNNLLDMDAAWRSASSFDEPAVCIVKHLSPCGMAVAGSLAEAFGAALACDPISAYGGIIAANRALDARTAAAIADLFVECIIAPGFEPAALALLAKKKNCRLVEMPDLKIEPQFELRSITRGVLRQSVDFGDPPGAQWQVVSQRQPSPEEWTALRFAWKACQQVKSNAIVLAQATATVGMGGGQPNRVDSVRIALQRAGKRARGAVMASDAFFPFPDSVELAAAAGVRAVVHPGGSIRDIESISAADRAGMAMLTTGVRHFRH